MGFIFQIYFSIYKIDFVLFQISPSEETLVASTASHQLYVFSLIAPDLGISKPEVKNIMARSKQKRGSTSSDQEDDDKVSINYFEFMAQSFHEGQIMGLDICCRKPLIATCAADRTVRIWNFETK